MKEISQVIPIIRILPGTDIIATGFITRTIVPVLKEITGLILPDAGLTTHVTNGKRIGMEVEVPEIVDMQVLEIMDMVVPEIVTGAVNGVITDTNIFTFSYRVTARDLFRRRLFLLGRSYYLIRIVL